MCSFGIIVSRAELNVQPLGSIREFRVRRERLVRVAGKRRRRSRSECGWIRRLVVCFVLSARHSLQIVFEDGQLAIRFSLAGKSVSARDICLARLNGERAQALRSLSPLRSRHAAL